MYLVRYQPSDPDYVPEPTEDTNIPDITLIALNEDGTAADGQGTDGWYRTKYITLTAPEGYNIVENPYARPLICGAFVSRYNLRVRSSLIVVLSSLIR